LSNANIVLFVRQVPLVPYPSTKQIFYTKYWT
jgi:hypothetical protein